MSGEQSIGKTAFYTLTAKDQNGNPIPNYQFKLKLAIMDKTTTVNELYEVNDHQYQGSLQHPNTHQLITVTPSDIGMTDSEGKVIVKIEYMADAPGYTLGAYDLNDGCFPLWYDENGNQIGHSGLKSQTPPVLIQ